MLKRLLVFILSLLVFVVARSQTVSDSLTKSPVVDTTLKQQPADTSAKHQLTDSTSARQRPADTVVKRHPADSMIQHTTVDTVVKHQALDTVANVSPAIPAKKAQHIKNTVKHVPAEKTQKSPHTPVAIKHSPIKTLSDRQYNAYLDGDDLDSMAMAGELNHYPLPDHALKYKVQIGLNPGQITRLKALAAALHRKKVEMGDNIIRNEKMLDSLFHSKQIVDGTLIFYTNRAGLYYGELRGAILMTCYETEKLLSDDQIRRLEALEKGD